MSESAFQRLFSVDYWDIIRIQSWLGVSWCLFWTFTIHHSDYINNYLGSWFFKTWESECVCANVCISRTFFHSQSIVAWFKQKNHMKGMWRQWHLGQSLSSFDWLVYHGPESLLQIIHYNWLLWFIHLYGKTSLPPATCPCDCTIYLCDSSWPSEYKIISFTSLSLMSLSITENSSKFWFNKA